MSEQPILAKISELDELLSTDAADNLVVVDVSEADATKRTKRARMDKLKLTSVDQIADGIVANSKISDNAVTSSKLATGAVTATKIADNAVIGGKIADNAISESKLGMIKRAVVLRIVAVEDPVNIFNIQNFFPWPITLNNFVVIDARINLTTASSSGSVIVSVINQGGTMTTLSLSAGQTGMTNSGTISASYRTAITNNFIGFNVTSAGTGATGLSVAIVLEGIPS